MNAMADFLASQPMHVGFTSDQGGNSIELRWFRHKSNLHHVTKSCFACVAHDSIPSPPRCWSKRCPMDGLSVSPQVWDREIIQTALADFYGKDMDAFRKQLEHNLTKASERD